MAKILIVEDSKSIRTHISGMLRVNDHTVYEAAHGKMALSIFEENEIDVVITDILMPEMDGLELIRELMRSNPGLPVIAMSGFHNIPYLRIAEKLGAIGTLSKPFEQQHLTRLLDELILQ